MATTLHQMEAMTEHAFSLKQTYEEAKKFMEEVHAKYKDQQLKIIAALEELQLTSYKSKFGNISYRYVSTFKTPKTPEQREAFFSFLQEKGIFDQMITVNSRTLNSWAKQEELANPDVLDFRIPGLEKSDPEPVISMTKAH